jgi:hypothetical protein
LPRTLEAKLGDKTVAYIPEDTQWFLAELVMEITVTGDERTVVHKNLVLVGAHSADDAYQKATELGAQSESRFENPSGNIVRIVFRGVSKLYVIYDHLEHGAELMYEEEIGLTEEEIARLIPPKETLSIFRPVTPSKGPDYSCKEILDEITHGLGNPD